MPARLTCERLSDRDCPAVFGNPWLHPDLTLSFAPDGTSVNGAPSRFDAALAGIPADQRTGELLRAFQSWVAVANVNVGVVADGGQPLGAAGPAFRDPRFGDVRVAAVPLAADNLALAYPFDVTAGTRAGDLTLNSAVPFVVGPSGGYDLYSVALHEAGHVFGLPGSTDPSSAMYQVADRVRTGPNADDVAAIRKLYGARQPDAFEGSRGNATIADASRPQPVNDVTTLTADLTTAADVDVYAFKADKLNGGAYLATLTASGYSLLVPTVEILDGRGTVIASGTGAHAGAADVALRVPGLTEGATYYARVHAADPTFSVGGYRLQLRAEHTVVGGGGGLDDPETGSDDTAAAAGDLKRLPSLGGTRQNFFFAASLGSAADVDFYRVRADLPSGTSAGVLTVSVVGTDGRATNPVVEVFDRNLVPQSFTVLTHDANEFTVQVPATDANRDYYVAVRHGAGAAAAAGNYSLGLDFGGPLVPLRPLASGTLTAAAPAAVGRIDVPAGQVMHLLVTAAPTPTPAAVRLSVFDASNAVVESRLAAAGGEASFNVFLPAGTYTYLVGGGATDGGDMPPVRYTILGMSISDPIGPQATTATAAPPTAPAATVTAPRPVTPTAAVPPTSPNILLVPPTDLPTPPTLLVRPAAAPPAATVSVGGSRVSTYDAAGNLLFTLDPFPGNAGPFRIAEADFTGDGVADVVVGTGPGSASAVRVIDGATRMVVYAIEPFEPAFTGGVFVAAGDVTGDGLADLIVTPDQGGGPRVRVFGGAGFAPVADFLGINDPNFRGGARAAVGDLNGDGVGDLVVAAGFAGGPRVAGYDGAALIRGTVRRVFNDFFAFEQTLRNGVYVAAADLNGDGVAEVVAGGGPGGGPRVLALDGRDLLAGRTTPVANFFGGDPAARDGARVAAKNLDDDGLDDLVVATGARTVGYAGSSLRAGLTPQVILDVLTPDGSASGVFVG